ncbi:MAG: methyltransferase [Leifsonia xyli]|nr:MAG: methyltransferase [Leifsonia xyli]
MDDPGCDLRLLENTYRLFPRVNRAFSGWQRIYLRRIRPLLDPVRPFRLLDVGSGGGDVARALAGWARRDGVRLEVTATDPDPRAHAYAQRTPDPDVVLLSASTAELLAAGARYDLAVSNHVLHHLDELAGFLGDCAALAPRGLHNDIRRSGTALALYSVVTRPLASRSFLYDDGRLSIRRSYTAEELRRAVPATWRVEPARPFRLLVTRGMGTGA